MYRLNDEVLKCADRVVQMSRDRGSVVLDYTDDSIGLVEEMLSEAAAHAGRMTEEALQRLSQDVGCYILEVARRNHGGAYQWAADRNEPALVVGAPLYAITLFCWEKVRDRLRGGSTHNISLFYAGYVARVGQAKPGDRAMFL
jgi:hypothetical protein